LTNWYIELTLNTGEDTFTLRQITELINTTGNYVGLGSYRPLNNGYFGRFELISIEEG
jgi:hypothetical protein